MSQASNQVHERRKHPRRPAAFAFWFEPVKAAGRASGWMLNVSTGGAAFLAAAEDAPAVGEIIRLSEMFSPDRFVREANPPLPAAARVLRVDQDDEGATRRVAVRFEADVAAPLPGLHRGQFVASCTGLRMPPPPPPVAAGTGIGAPVHVGGPC